MLQQRNDSHLCYVINFTSKGSGSFVNICNFLLLIIWVYTQSRILISSCASQKYGRIFPGVYDVIISSTWSNDVNIRWHKMKTFFKPILLSTPQMHVAEQHLGLQTLNPLWIMVQYLLPSGTVLELQPDLYNVNDLG